MHKRMPVWMMLCVLGLAAPAVAQPVEEGAPVEEGQPAEEGAPIEEEGVPAEEGQSAEESVPAEEGVPADGEPPGREAASARSRRLTFLLTANIDGRFAQPDCRSEEVVDNDELYYAQQAGYFNTLRSLAEGAGQPAPIALNTGDSVFPGAISRYLLAQELPGMRNLMINLVQIPYEAHAIGNRELSVPRSALVDFVTSAEEAGLRLQGANVRCAEFAGAEALCEALGAIPGRQPYGVVTRDGLSVALTSVLDPQVLQTLGPRQAEGLSVLDPIELLPPLVHTMRGEANLVVVQFHVRSKDAVYKAHELARQVPGIDILIVNHLIDDDATAGSGSTHPDAAGGPSMDAAYLRAQQTGTFIVSSNSGPRHVVTLEVDAVAGEGGAWRVRSVYPRLVATADVPADREAAELLATVARAYCDDWGRPIGEQAPLAEPFELADLQAFILNVMRFETRSEVALLNARAFRNVENFPLTGELTLSDVYSALPFDNQLTLIEVPGAVLSALGPRLGSGLVAAGMEYDGERVLINGRAVEGGRIYRVATNEFLAEGGDGVFALDQLRNVRAYDPSWSAEVPTISDTVVRYVESGAYRRGGTVTDALSPTGNFADLHRKFLWRLTGSLNASYHKVNVVNPTTGEGEPGYTQSQLTVASTDQLNLEGRWLLRADSRNHGWDNDLNLQYATARITDGDTGFEETKDLIRFRSQYRFKGFRADLGGRWWVPNPMVELQLESEFDPPETRDWRRMDTRGILGVTFLIADPLEFKLGANVRRDINEPDSEATYGVNAGYALRRISLASVFGRPIQFESELEYFYNDVGNSNIHELRNGNRLFFALFDQFFFTTTFNVFLYRTDAVGRFGTNTELTIGLNYLWDASRQTF